MSQNLLA